MKAILQKETGTGRDHLFRTATGTGRGRRHLADPGATAGTTAGTIEDRQTVLRMRSQEGTGSKTKWRWTVTELLEKTMSRK